VWALLNEIGKKQEEDRLQRKENERILNEKFAETDRQMKETDRQMKETDRQMKETDKRINKIIGEWGTNIGYFAEDYFINSFKKGQKNFFGENFDEIRKRVGGVKIEDEYDILLINGKSENKDVENKEPGITASVKCLRGEGVRTENDEDILHRLLIVLRIPEI
jgi:hypothetical protein